jgi:hypothetical protein
MVTDTSGEDWAPATVTEAVAALVADGYTTDFSVAPGGMLRCGDCDTLHDPGQALVDRIVRFEGETDPGDEAIVFALTCGGCGIKGTLVSAYGASVGVDEATVVTALSTRG